MEDLAKDWKKLSLSTKEDDKFDLSKNKKIQNYVLTAKFFTRHSVNIEAVAKTFRPLWRTRGKFEVSDAGNNILLFTFELNADIEKFLMGEPWSFDRHLVVFQRYDISTPMEDLKFDKVSFWIQIHNLPYSLLSVEVAQSLGGSLGTVKMPTDQAEMRGGKFMRVKVSIDVSEPLCRGRRVNFDKNNEGWVSFMYERLSNLCYWCGKLTHDDKECAIWLQSGGSLSSNDQQFGPWLRASQYNPMKKTVIEVQGYDKQDVTIKQKVGLHSHQKDMGRISPPERRWRKESDERAAGMNVSNEPEKSGSINSGTISTETNQEIYEDIQGNLSIQMSNVKNTELKGETGGKLLDMEYEETRAEVKEYQLAEFKIPVMQQRKEQGEPVGPIFNMGWGESGKTKKNKKGELKEKTNKTEVGLIQPNQEEGPRPKGTWVRISRPQSQADDTPEHKEGPKRKIMQQNTEGGLAQEKEKKLKMEETKNFSMLLASKFGSAEVAGQPRRVQ